MSGTLEHEWELELPGETPEQILAGMVARDRLFGQAVTLEPEEDESNSVEAWFGTTDDLDGTTYKLGVYVELTGPEDYLEPARDALEEIMGEQLEIAATEAENAVLVDRRPLAEITFEKVAEDDENQQLVMPEWLAPEGAELPWGFVGVDASGRVWPGDETMKAHGRVVLVPYKDELFVYGLPPIEDEEEEAAD